MTGRLFDTYLFVDWSARSSPSPKRPTADAIWSAELTAGSAPMVAYHRTRQLAFEHLAARLRFALAERRRILVGCDFPYGYPAGFAASLGDAAAAPWRITWERLAAAVQDGADNANNRFEVVNRWNAAIGSGLGGSQLAGGRPGPFWGHPTTLRFDALARKSPGFPYRLRNGRQLQRLRLCEARLPGTQETWKLFGAGSVGSQALTGIPRLIALRDAPDLAAHSRVWPFETGFTARPAGGEVLIVHAEIWPGIVGAGVEAGKGAIKDAVQVEKLCEWAERRDAAGTLGACFAEPEGLTDAQREACLREEGWVLGA